MGHLPQSVTTFISAALPYVYLSNYSLTHILEKHGDVSRFDLLCIPMMLSDGLWVGQKDRLGPDGKPNSACVSFVHPETAVRYAGSVKSAAGGFEVYLNTFHRTKPRQTRSTLKRGPILQTHK